MADDAYYKQQFFAESREMLDSVSDALLRIEANPADAEALHAIFRSIHTIKGSAGVFSLQEVSAFAHHVESVLNKACEGIIPVTSELVDLFFQGVDALNALLDDAQHGQPQLVDLDLVARFQAVSTGQAAQSGEAAKPEAKSAAKSASPAHSTQPLSKENIPDGLRGLLRSKSAQGMALYRIKLNFTSEMLENGYDPAVLLRNLKSLSKLWGAFTEEPSVTLEDFQPLTLYLHATVYMATTAKLEEILELAFEPELMDVVELAENAAQDLDAELLRDFVEESASLIEQMETSALTYERTGAADALNSLFRAVHTTKGDASYVGLKRLGTFAHELEGLLDKLRNGKLTPTGSVMDDILARVDTLKKAIQRVQQGETDPEIETAPQEVVNTPEKVDPVAPEVSTVFLNQVTQHRHVLETLCGSALPKSEESTYRVRRVCQGLISAARFVGLEELVELTTGLEKTLDASDASGYTQARVKLLAWLNDITGKPRKLGEILIQSGHVTSADLQSVLSQQKPLGELLVEEGKLDRETLDVALKKQAIMRVAQQQQQAAETPQQPDQAQPGMEIRVMRVDEEKIDALSNLIGELVVAKNTYDYLLREVFSAGHLPPEVSKSFKDNLYLFSRLASGLQQSLLSVRMIPIRGVFQKYARVVRDIARKQQKIIDFITEGEDTEVDKKVADLLSEPLIHMVRNACDHGIETPEERRLAGKPEKGTVLLRAWQEGSRLYVQVRDDGKGINRQKVYEKALIRGFEFESPEDEGLLNVIFESGFSTKDEVTDVSGRGVGMDAVRSSVESLGGTISLESTQGLGSTITLELPMTMGITVALVVRAKEKHYAIPLDSVVENIKVLPSQVKMFYDRKGIAYRGQVLPIERLDTLLFNSERTGDPRDLFRESPFSTFALERDDEELSVVVLNTAHGKFGVVVDGVTRNVELAIRPVPDVLRDINVLSGVSILGDGKILLVLNPDNLV